MSSTLVKALAALAPVSLLFGGSLISFNRGRTGWTLLQLLGSACLVLVVLSHIAEGLHLLAWMHWGARNSVGHYLDLGSAILGVSFFPVGFFGNVLTRRLA